MEIFAELRQFGSPWDLPEMFETPGGLGRNLNAAAEKRGHWPSTVRSMAAGVVQLQKKHPHISVKKAMTENSNESTTIMTYYDYIVLSCWVVSKSRSFQWS